jgi:2-oxoglutarate dehydrogenase E1 component
MLQARLCRRRVSLVCYVPSPNFRASSTSNSKDVSSSLSSKEIEILRRRVLRGLSAMRNRGHYAATLDPLSNKQQQQLLGALVDYEPDVVRFLKPAEDGSSEGYNFSVIPKMGQSVNISPYLDKPLLSLYDDLYLKPDPLDPEDSHNKHKLWSVNGIIKALQGTYAANVGVETSHVENEIQKSWLLNQVEAHMSPEQSTWTRVDPLQQKRNLYRLIRTDHAAKFLSKKFPSAKVFGIEGCESLIPGLWAILERGSHKWGMEGVEMGMAHRGRVNVLHDVLGKSFRSILTDFNESEHFYGDVRYHLGTRATVATKGLRPEDEDKRVHISLAANPSHLEAVNPVVMGKCKAKQRLLNDDTQRRVMPILLHGDASFSGQGIVPECLELSNMAEYNVGGTIHIIINNQIGFTTDPRQGRTSYHCTDVAKGVGAPIFHVNGDDVDAVSAVCKIAVDWRMKFKRDCVVDIVCYRRHGHNEQDDPKITHPVMTKKIQQHPPTLEIYMNKLIDQGLITENEYLSMCNEVTDEYEEDFQVAMNYAPDPVEWLQSNWQGDALGTLLSKRPFNTTGVRWNVLQNLGKSFTTIPEHIVVHKDVKKILNKYSKVFETGEGVTWALAEALAFGSLVTKFRPTDPEGIFENSGSNADLSGAESVALVDEWNEVESMMVEHPVVNVRLSGQDCVRGTFNQRHAAIICQETGEQYWPLKNLATGGFAEQAQIDIVNSNLSEFAVMGFEYGYSLSNEMALTIFEAQFGDFANNAQCIIDNFIVSGEQKWNNKSSIVLLLPHGYEGNGPEHSSGRLERFLSMVDDDQDAIPGKSDFNKAEIEAGFDMVDAEGTGIIDKANLRGLFTKFAGHDPVGLDATLKELMEDLGVKTNSGEEGITRKVWYDTMSAWLVARAEQKHNLIVCAPSTPSQYFHCLRRQVHRPYAKPLVMMSAKWMLHHALCVSQLKALSLGTHFQRVIMEGPTYKGDNTTWRMKNPLVSDENIKKVIFCSGKIFYQLFHLREAHQKLDVTFVRLEQIAPFPYDIINTVLARYPKADFVWCQEEPKNMGAYFYVKPRLATAMANLEAEGGAIERPLHYVGRMPSGAPANGGMRQHLVDQKDILEKAIGIKS